jgi:heat shock protein HtpX
MIGHLLDDLELVAAAFMAKAKMSSIHFVISRGSGSGGGPTQPGDGVGKGLLKRIFAGNSTNLFLVLLAASIVLLFVFGSYAIVAVISVQIVALYYSDRMALAMGEVRLASDNPSVTTVSVKTSPETVKFLKLAGKKTLAKIKGELEGALLEPVSGPATKEVIKGVLSANRIETELDEIRVVDKDVFGLVKRTADRFGLPTPKITILSAFQDNAAATGIWPSRSSIAITAGAIEDLNDEELQSVVGHEFGHVKGRDPVILFCTTSLVIFGGLYLWTPLLEYLGFFYFLFAFALIYAVGKVLETRADTASAMVLGDAKVLAGALTSMGYPQLYREKRSSGARLVDWLIFDSHPPMYFRVDRLNRIAEKGNNVRHAFAVSVRDSLDGFLKALLGRE